MIHVVTRRRRKRKRNVKGKNGGGGGGNTPSHARSANNGPGLPDYDSAFNEHFFYNYFFSTYLERF
jgi:hypothetical protein